MAIELDQTLNVIEIMENFMVKARPPEHIRDKLDLGYRIENQSVIIFEIHPKFWTDNDEKVESEFAKATYVKRHGHWKIFWMRANLKWYPYDPHPTARTLKKVIEIIDKDEWACFRG